MKKLLFNFTVILIIIALTACAGTENNIVPEGNDKSTVQPAANDEKYEDKSTSNDINRHTSEEVPETGNVPKSAKDIYALIPDGWHMIESPFGEPAKAEGDLNKDGISDVAAVIEGPVQGEESPPWALIIAFGNADKTFSLSIKADKAVLTKDEGGVWGDPFEGIAVDRGSVLLKFYGGSNWRWYQTYRFRYQEDDWYLIGATLGSYFTGTTERENADEEDYNLLTGDYIIKKTDEQGKMKITKGNRGKRKLVKLRDFVANSEEKQF